jgi:tetratricopeptide (TPR) repeat protein
MAKRSSRSAPPPSAPPSSRPAARFFERFREEVGRYAEGVHDLGPPAPAAELAGLPDELASFLRSWNGAELFVDAVRIAPAREISREGGLVLFGSTAMEDRLALDERGRVLKLEEDTGESVVEGTSFARWIEALVSAESVFYDREGEFKEGVFDETGEEPTPDASARREKKALRLDPGAPAPAWRLARAVERLGRGREARRLLEDVCESEPEFAWAWFDLGRLRRAAGDHAGAEDAFARASDVDTGDNAAYFAAHAAREALARGDEPARAKHAARALDLDPSIASSQRRAAETRFAEGAVAEAGELLAVALAVSPLDVEALALKRKLNV